MRLSIQSFLIYHIIWKNTFLVCYRFTTCEPRLIVSRFYFSIDYLNIKKKIACLVQLAAVGLRRHHCCCCCCCCCSCSCSQLVKLARLINFIAEIAFSSCLSFYLLAFTCFFHILITFIFVIISTNIQLVDVIDCFLFVCLFICQPKETIAIKNLLSSVDGDQQDRQLDRWRNGRTKATCLHCYFSRRQDNLFE